MFGNVNRPALSKDLKLEENLEILMVIALGKPKEKVVLEKIPSDGNVKYWRDEKGVHHVPKRELEDLIIRK